MYLVGDADRERGIALLRRHYAEGRIEVEELAERAEAVTRARTTAELQDALRDLPGGRMLSTVAPRVVAFQQSDLGTVVVRRAARLLLAVAVVGAWILASTILLLSLGVAMLIAGVSAALTAAFTLAWVAMSWLFWRVGRAGLRRR
jgi:predicted phage tail protein